jgi:hypothetical protein
VFEVAPSYQSNGGSPWRHDRLTDDLAPGRTCPQGRTRALSCQLSGSRRAPIRDGCPRKRTKTSPINFLLAPSQRSSFFSAWRRSDAELSIYTWTNKLTALPVFLYGFVDKSGRPRAVFFAEWRVYIGTLTPLIPTMSRNLRAGQPSKRQSQNEIRNSVRRTRPGESVPRGLVIPIPNKVSANSRRERSAI